MWALFGILLSAAWLGAVYWSLDEFYGIENVLLFAPNEIGQIVAGIAAVLALIWILISYIRNGSMLHRVSDELVDLREAVQQQRAVAARAETAQRLSVPAATAAPRVAPPAPPPQVQPAPALRPVPPPAPLERKAPPVERAPGPALTPAPAPTAVLTPTGPSAAALAPLALGSSPDTAMLPPDDGEAEAERTAPEPASIGALASEVARNLERLEAGKPPLSSPIVASAPMALPEAPVELDPELQQQLNRVARDLNAISMDLSAVLCRKSARDDALKSYNRGHKEAFHLLVRDYLSRHEPAEIVSRLAQADATSLLHTYAVKFASLVDEAKRHDPSGGQEALLRQSTLGQLYAAVLRHTAAARGPLRA